MRKGKRERNTIIEIVRGKRNTKKDKQKKKKKKRDIEHSNRQHEGKKEVFLLLPLQTTKFLGSFKKQTKLRCSRKFRNIFSPFAKFFQRIFFTTFSTFLSSFLEPASSILIGDNPLEFQSIQESLNGHLEIERKQLLKKKIYEKRRRRRAENIVSICKLFVQILLHNPCHKQKYHKERNF